MQDDIVKPATTRWGILSAGGIASDFATAIRNCSPEEHEIVAVAARSIDKAKEFSSKFNIAQAYGSYEELAQDPNVEIAYIGTIHPYHADLMKLMLNNGKHVVCEKPITMNCRQAKEVVQLAKEKGLFLMEAFWTRFFPVVDDLRKELASKSIGEVKVLTVNFGQDIEKKRRLHVKKMGGGAVLDLGCYSVMFANLIFGTEKPERIVASGTLLETGVDQMVSVTIHFANSRMASLNITMNCMMDNVAQIFGSKGCIKVPDFWHPTEMITPETKCTHELPTSSLPVNYGCSEGLIYEVQGVRQSLLKGELESPLVPHEDSLWIMEVMDEIRRQIGVHYDADDQ